MFVDFCLNARVFNSCIAAELTDHVTCNFTWCKTSKDIAGWTGYVPVNILIILEAQNVLPVDVVKKSIPVWADFSQFQLRNNICVNTGSNIVAVYFIAVFCTVCAKRRIFNTKADGKYVCHCVLIFNRQNKTSYFYSWKERTCVALILF